MTKFLFIEYPKCSTCQKAKKWLDNHNISYQDRHIIDNRPTVDELQLWVKQSGKDLKSFFNTSGLVYKSLNLKNSLPKMSEEEKYQILASNGMLVKRPLLIGEDFVLTGFREADWQKILQAEL